MSKKRIIDIVMLVVLAVGVALAAYGVTGRSIYTNAAAMTGGDQKAAIGYIQDPSTLTRLEDVSKVGADKVKGFLKGLGLDASAVDAAVDARQQYEDALGKVSDRTDASLVMKEMGITDEAQYQAIADNTALLRAQPEYVAQLRTLPPHLRQMWLEGRWDVGAGQFFAEFRDDPTHYDDHLFTHVIEPFQIPAGWSVYRSYDFGYNKPFSCAWWAMDEDGVAYRFLELYGCTETPNEGVRWAPERQFREIGRIEREHPWLRGRNIRGVADPAIWDKSHGESIAETAGRCGVWFQKGDNQRIPGWMQMHYRMSFDGHGRAQLYVFKTCRAFIRTIPLLLYDSRRPEDLDTDLEDHVADESRYFCMMRPVAARPIEAPKPRLFDPLAEGTVPRRNAFGR